MTRTRLIIFVAFIYFCYLIDIVIIRVHWFDVSISFIHADLTRLVNYHYLRCI